MVEYYVHNTADVRPMVEYYVHNTADVRPIVIYYVHNTADVITMLNTMYIIYKSNLSCYSIYIFMKQVYDFLSSKPLCLLKKTKILK